MSISLMRSRLAQTLVKPNILRSAVSSSTRRLFCTAPPPPPQKKNPLITAITYALSGSLLGLTAAVSYTTYAYSLEDVDKKTKAFRALANSPTVRDDKNNNDGFSFDKLKGSVRSAILAVPAKGIQLYIDMRRSIEESIREFTEPLSDKLLPDLPPNIPPNVCTLVLDLNETLVYSDWKRERGWRTFKRPGVDAFLEHLAQYYEIVVYSDNLQMYVEPVVDRLDEKHSLVSYRLNRSATRYKDGIHYRDLSMLNRDPGKVIYISAHALESCLQPENSIPIKPWAGDDVNDTALLDLLPFLEFLARSCPADVRKVLASYQGRDVAKEFIERSKEHQRRMQEQKHGRFWRR